MRDEGVAEDLRHIEILGRLILRTIHRLEKQMAEQNVTTQNILDAVRAQRGQLASLSTLVAGIKARLNAALEGAISPAAQATLNDIMSEIQGNSRAITDAVATNDDDTSTVASDGSGGIFIGGDTGTGNGGAGGAGSAGQIEPPAEIEPALVETAPAEPSEPDAPPAQPGVAEAPAA